MPRKVESIPFKNYDDSKTFCARGARANIVGGLPLTYTQTLVNMYITIFAFHALLPLLENPTAASKIESPLKLNKRNFHVLPSSLNSLLIPDMISAPDFD